MESTSTLSVGSAAPQEQLPPLPETRRLAGRSLRPALQVGLRTFGILGCLAAGGALTMYLLALLALRDLAATPGLKQHVSAASGYTVTAMNDGTAKVLSDDGSAMDLGGHAAPIKAAEIVGGGTFLMSADARGHVRFTALEAARGLNTAGVPGLGIRFYDAVWRPYGARFARWSLDWVALILPLHIPDSLKGGRGRIFRDCDLCPEMVEIGSGMFFMGSPLTEWERSSDEGPRHLEAISQPFAVGRFEVTFDEWDACVKERGCRHDPADEKGARGRRPVVNVSWSDAKEYLDWLNAKVAATEQSGSKVKPESSKVTQKMRYRLLTEAEWEYVARAGTTGRYSSGERIATSQARFSTGQPGSAGWTLAVGSFSDNSFGVFDMHGNVWEWVDDCYAASYQDKVSGAGLQQAKVAAEDLASCERVLRGGSWNSLPAVVRSAARGGEKANLSSASTGFRVAKTMTP